MSGQRKLNRCERGLKRALRGGHTQAVPRPQFCSLLGNRFRYGERDDVIRMKKNSPILFS
jgi:hypothetical protein